MIEESIERGTQWVVFEPNDPFLWGRVKRDVSAFLKVIWRTGALFGATPDQAFYVKCDEETNPPELRDLGQMVVEIGIHQLNQPSSSSSASVNGHRMLKVS
jgi:hypothetical protein